MAVLRWFVGFIITVSIAVFAVLNREEVSFFWNPLVSDEAIVIPVYMVALGSMALGFVFGGVIVWFNAANVRRERRKQKKEIKVLEKELDRLKEDKYLTEPPAPEIFPAIAAK